MANNFLVERRCVLVKPQPSDLTPDRRTSATMARATSMPAVTPPPVKSTGGFGGGAGPSCASAASAPCCSGWVKTGQEGLPWDPGPTVGMEAIQWLRRVRTESQVYSGPCACKRMEACVPAYDPQWLTATGRTALTNSSSYERVSRGMMSSLVTFVRPVFRAGREAQRTCS